MEKNMPKQIKKNIGKVIVVFGLISVFLLISFLKADYTTFLSKLKIMGIAVENLQKQLTVSRYELTRLLNTVECKDCIVPDVNMKNKYTNAFWINFIELPGKDFGDISYGGALFNNLSHYYCVAYAGDNGYMRGYPKTTDYCPGKFCGTNNVTVGEFYQVVINLIGKYIYRNFEINWSRAKSWADSLKSGTLAYIYLDQESKNIISQNAEKCTQGKCALQNNADFQVYLKYCMFNVKECNMKEFEKIKEATWPIAELNVLLNQNIIDVKEAEAIQVNKLADGKKILEVFYKVNEIIGCDFNDDYDCDGIKNKDDNAPYDYNKLQKDFDGDGIGDVADDDIDGDGVKNPFGIVDDNGRINASVLSGWSGILDNCIFTPNFNQNDEGNNKIGDACENSQDKLGMYINIDKFVRNNGLQVNFKAVTQGSLKSVQWDFGDGTSKQSGKSITHTYPKSGLYKVNAIAKGANNDAKANITVFVGENTYDYYAIQVDANKIGGQMNNLEVNFSLNYRGKFDEVEWIFPENKIKKQANQSFSKMFLKIGTFPVTANAYKNGKIVASSHITVGVGRVSVGSLIKSDNVLPNINENIHLETKYFGFRLSDILNIKRDFGDGVIKNGVSLVPSHKYEKSGKKIITQKIYLRNGSLLNNFITVYVVDTSLINSYSMILSVDNLISEINKKINFKISSIGDKIPTFLLGVYQSDIGVTEKFNDSLPLVKTYPYYGESIYYPQTTIYVDKCIVLQSKATVVTQGVDVCLQSKLDGNLQTKYKCDMDKDGIPDICDDDIDGDGVKNLLGIIKFENPDCSLNANNINVYNGGNNDGSNNGNNNGNLNILNDHFNGICTLDNCPFSSNSNQLDLNSDGIGNLCSSQLGNIKNNLGADNGNGGDGNNNLIGNSNNGSNNGNLFDTDGDGITNDKDLCPLVPEDYNGIQDSDGCPEIGLDLGCFAVCGDGKKDIGETCQTCPEDVGNCSCGNGVIDNGETCINCHEDVEICVSVCGNGSGEVGENCINCPEDVPVCGICGNGIKDSDESCKTCPQDYGECGIVLCGNGIIDEGEYCNNCPEDVRRCTNTCGNLGIEYGEQCDDGNKIDNDGCSNICLSCGNGEIDPGEDCNNCPLDVGECIDIIQAPCDTCPCQFADFEGVLIKDDTVKALLRDFTKSVLYKVSSPIKMY